MSKIIILLMLILSLISCSKKSDNNNLKENVKTEVKVGAWDINPKQANSIDDNIKDVFSIATKQLLGVKRELMLYLGSQVVNGVNHAFICRSTVVYPSALPYYEIIICNVSADNEISIVKLDKIIESSQSEVGGIVCTSSDEAKINISNSKEANDLIKIFQNAVKDIKDIKYTQELYVASQVVKGVNYSFVTKALSNDGSVSIKLLTINNFIESSEIVEVEDIL